MRKQKHPRLPSGFGSIRYLGKNRSRPYQVRAAAHADGDSITAGEILAYTDDWYKAFALLTAYNAHTWHPGDDVEESSILQSENLDGLVRRLLDDYRILTGKSYTVTRSTSFIDVVEAWYKDKYEQEEKKVFAKGTKQNAKKGIILLRPLYDRPFVTLRLQDLQATIDGIEKPTMQAAAKAVLHGVYKYAVIHEIVEKDYSIGVRTDAHKNKSGTPFNPQEIKKLWKMRDQEEAEMLLIMIYSGFRISAYETLEVNLEDKYFKGGVKTAASKDRIVPIHSAILPLVKKRLKRGPMMHDFHNYGMRLSNWCRSNGMDHTPHHTRHTFSMLCEKYGVKENDRKRLLGHTFRDITNGVYGHRELEDLRQEIEKIPICDNL